MDIDTFTNGMGMLSATFDRDDISEEKIRARYHAYELSLADLDGDAFIEACVRCMRTIRFFPTPAELLGAARAIDMERHPDGYISDFERRRQQEDEDLRERVRLTEAKIREEMEEKLSRARRLADGGVDQVDEDAAQQLVAQLLAEEPASDGNVVQFADAVMRRREMLVTRAKSREEILAQAREYTEQYEQRARTDAAAGDGAAS